MSIFPSVELKAAESKLSWWSVSRCIQSTLTTVCRDDHRKIHYKYACDSIALNFALLFHTPCAYTAGESFVINQINTCPLQGVLRSSFRPPNASPRRLRVYAGWPAARIISRTGSQYVVGSRTHEWSLAINYVRSGANKDVLMRADWRT